MQRTVTAGDRELTLEANGATPYAYKKVFGEDLLLQLKQAEDQYKDGEDASRFIEIMPKLAYVMVLQHDDNWRKGTNYDTFCDWVSQFGPMDLADGDFVSQVYRLYTGQAEPSVEVKKNQV